MRHNSGNIFWCFGVCDFNVCDGDKNTSHSRSFLFVVTSLVLVSGANAVVLFRAKDRALYDFFQIVLCMIKFNIFVGDEIYEFCDCV